METNLLEITLISAQGLKPPPGHRRLQTYAVTWVDPAHKLRTGVDRAGRTDPAWNDRFIFRVPTAFLADDSPSAVSVEIYAAAGFLLHDSLVGSVRFLVGGERLLLRPRGTASFAALGIRRPSGRVSGVLNIGAAVMEKVSKLAAEMLTRSPAVSYRDLMMRNGVSSAVLQDRTNLEEKDQGDVGKSKSVLQEEEDQEEDDDESCGVVFCGPCLLQLPKKIHLSPSDENFQFDLSAPSPSR